MDVGALRAAASREPGVLGLLNYAGSLQDNGDVVGCLPFDEPLEIAVKGFLVALNVAVGPDGYPLPTSEPIRDPLEACPADGCPALLGAEQKHERIRGHLTDAEGCLAGRRRQLGPRGHALADRRLNRASHRCILRAVCRPDKGQKPGQVTTSSAA